MGMPNQGMKLPTTGTTTTPNGRTFNTNPAANQMMADRARMAREQRMQPSPQGMGQIGGYNPPSPPNMAQYEAMQKDIAKQRESTSAQDPARFLRQRDIEDSANQRVAYMGPQAAQGGMGQAQQTNQEPIRRTPMTFAQQQAQDQAMMQAKMQAAQQQAPQAVQSGMGGMGGKGGQPPSPQQLGQGLQQQAMMQGQMPYRGASASQMFGMQAPQQQGQMSGQGQPQGRMPPQMPMRGRR